ncbi:MAG: SUMF1/EgtB/PvdO family nonheme iron enzyme [Lentisphaeraceae bacterium]|nr:SUMF1/EgtB/PvdO family nonheme iron enzyme [Lentisphaeraceae bacterium]
MKKEQPDDLSSDSRAIKKQLTLKPSLPPKATNSTQPVKKLRIKHPPVPKNNSHEKPPAAQAQRDNTRNQGFYKNEAVMNPQGPIFPSSTVKPLLPKQPQPSSIIEKQTSRVPPAKAPLLEAASTATIITDSLAQDYCFVKAGTYFIGEQNEEVHLQTPFTLARHPVTKKDFLLFLKETEISFPKKDLNELHKVSPQENCPAVMISWQDAKNYCRWLRAKTGDYYSLPSFAEWEAAARGPKGLIYPWGEQEPNNTLASFSGISTKRLSTSPIVDFQRNISPCGCRGMVGNIMEWTVDSFEDERDPHILKGGCWESSIDYCNNVTPCISFPPTRRQNFVGLRVLYLPKELHENYKENNL